jgi:hypothetical protein
LRNIRVGDKFVSEASIVAIQIETNGDERLSLHVRSVFDI